MKKTDIAASQPSYEEILRKERRANSAWNKLRRNKTAMIGLFIIVIMTAIAVFAPFITGGKPNEIHPIDAYLGFFERGICSARMKPEGIYLQGYATEPGSLFWLQWGPRYWAVSSGWPWGLYQVTPEAWWMRSLCAAWTALWHFRSSCCQLS